MAPPPPKSGWVNDTSLDPDSSASPPTSPLPAAAPAPSAAPRALSHSASLADLAAEREEADKGLLRRFREDERGQREVAHAAYRARATSDSRVSSPPRGGGGGAGAAAGGGGPALGGGGGGGGGAGGAFGEEAAEEPHLPPFFDFTLPLIRQASVAMVDDSFTRCFKSKKVVKWNWNCYLWPTWALGVVVRYCILFPIRLTTLLLGFVLVMLLMMPAIKLLGLFMDTQKMEILCVVCGGGAPPRPPSSGPPPLTYPPPPPLPPPFPTIPCASNPAARSRCSRGRLCCRGRAWCASTASAPRPGPAKRRACSWPTTPP
jgi:hypothetical protein